jgi:hypothetical protein
MLVATSFERPEWKPRLVSQMSNKTRDFMCAFL